MVFIIHATHECAIHEKSAHRLVSDKIFSYAKLRDQIRHIFQLASSAPFETSYKDHNKEFVSFVNHDGLVDAFQRQNINPLRTKVVHKCSSPFVRVVHGNTCHLLTLPPGPLEYPPSQLEFCYEQLRVRVRKLFKLLPSANFCFSYKERDLKCGPHMTVANDEELKYALTKESPNYLQLDIHVIEEDNENNIRYSSGENHTRKTSFDVVKIWHDGTVRDLAPPPVELESSCEKFHSQIRNVFKLPRSTKLQLSYVDKDEENIIISKGMILKDALSWQQGQPLRLDVVKKSSVVPTASSYVVKVSHKRTLRRLTLPPDEFQFLFEKFRNSVRDLFKFPPPVRFVLSYIDEDQDDITMDKDEDLRDALVLQSLKPLKVTVVRSPDVLSEFSSDSSSDHFERPSRTYMCS